jgi:hypothetical protein
MGGIKSFQEVEQRRSRCDRANQHDIGVQERVAFGMRSVTILDGVVSDHVVDRICSSGEWSVDHTGEGDRRVFPWRDG